MGKEDAILNSSQLNKAIGMIIPPPETKKFIDKAAGLVAKYGKEMEEEMRNNPNPLVSFLKESDPYNNYYQQRIKEIKAEIENEEKEEEAKKENKETETFLNKKRENETPLQESNIKKESSFQDELRSMLNSNISSLTKTENISLTNAIRNAKQPKPDQFSISHPNIQSLDMDIIKITAQFVAKNGEKFLSDLSQRESKNAQFNFLKPQHILFGYFTYLVGSYTKIITDKKEKIKKLIQYSSDKESILKEANNRVLYEKKIKKMQKSKKYNETDFMTEEEKKKNTVINWYDFVVVDTIDFDNEVIDDAIKEENEKVHQEQINQISPIEETQQIEPIINNEEIKEETIANKEEEEIDTSSKQPTNIKIVKNYTRPSMKAKKESTEIKCPLCKLSIAEDTFQDHIRLELLDPKWKEVQKEIASRTEDSSLASTSEFLTYLGDFSKSRPDLFGDIDDIHNFEQKKKNEPSVPNHQIWSGYNPFMSRTTANITMFKQQNKKHLEESKKAQQMASNTNNKK